MRLMIFILVSLLVLYSTATMICPACGRTYPDDAVYCEDDGTKLKHKTVLKKVPNLLGMEESKARELITSLGWNVGRVENISSDQPLGTVVAQKPIAGTELKPGSTITLQISAIVGKTLSPEFYISAPLRVDSTQIKQRWESASFMVKMKGKGFGTLKECMDQFLKYWKWEETTIEALARDYVNKTSQLVEEQENLRKQMGKLTLNEGFTNLGISDTIRKKYPSNYSDKVSSADRDAELQLTIDEYDKQMERLSAQRETELKPYLIKRQDDRKKLISKFEKCSSDMNDPAKSWLFMVLGLLYVERAAEQADQIRSTTSKFAAEHPEQEYETYSPGQIYQTASDSFKKAIQLGKDNPGLDIAYYNLANTLAEEGDSISARKQLEVLVKKYPSSFYADDSYYHIGDLCFYEDRYKDAVCFYQGVRKDSRIYSRALLKQGWSYFNLAKTKSAECMSYFPKAVECFLQLLDDYTAKQDEDSRIRFMASILAEWATSLEGFGTEQEDVVELTKGILQESATTKGQSEKLYAAKLFEFLGNYYVNDGRDDDAIKAYNKVLDRYPQYPGCAKVLKSINRCYQRQNNLPAAIGSLEKLIKNYGPESSWAKAEMSEVEDFFNLFLVYKQALADVANHYYNQHLKTKTKQDAVKAMKYLQIYVEIFAYDKDTSKYRDYISKLSIEG